MRCTERCERDRKPVIANLEIAVGLQRGVDQRPSFVLDAPVMGRDEPDEIGLDLEGDHLEDVRQELALGR